MQAQQEWQRPATWQVAIHPRCLQASIQSACGPSTPDPAAAPPHLLYAARHSSSAATFLACATFCRWRCSRRAAAFWLRMALSCGEAGEVREGQ